MPLRTSIEVSVSNVYGRPVEQLATHLPRRKQFTDFRFIRQDERVTFMATDGSVKEHDPASTYRFGGPRLIVGTPALRRVTFNETGVEAIPATGQWFMDTDGSINRAVAGVVYNTPMMLVTRTLEEVPQQ